MDEPTSGEPTSSEPGRLGMAAPIGLLALLTAACWFGWFAWDDSYQVDASGVPSGPYEAWQGVGAGICLAAVVVLGTVWTGPATTVLTVSVAFAGSWAVTQAARDETGLWLVGAVGTLVGTAAGAALVAYATTVVGARRRRPA